MTIKRNGLRVKPHPSPSPKREGFASLLQGGGWRGVLALAQVLRLIFLILSPNPLKQLTEN